MAVWVALAAFGCTPRGVAPPADAVAPAPGDGGPAARSDGGSSTRSFLRWDIEPAPGPCLPRALEWVDGDDRVVWSRDPPTWMRVHPFDCETVARYQRAPREGRLAATLAVSGVGATDAVAIGDVRGALVLRQSDGVALFDWAAPGDAGTTFFFDDGRFRFDGAPPCSGAAVMAFVFARCGASLVYFNGATALEIDAGSWRVAATGSVRDSTVRGARTKEVAGSVRLGNRALWLQGIVDD